MEKKYYYKEFLIDPRTTLSRANNALFECIDKKTTTPAEIFTSIDIAYSTGKHRSPSYIKDVKKKTLKLFNQFVFE